MARLEGYINKDAANGRRSARIERRSRREEKRGERGEGNTERVGAREEGGGEFDVHLEENDISLLSGGDDDLLGKLVYGLKLGIDLL